MCVISAHMRYASVLPPLPLPGLMHFSLSSFSIIPFSITANIYFPPLTEKTNWSYLQIVPFL